MTALLYLLYVVHVLVSLFLILVVLFQQGKGADLSVFGGGSTQAAFGARGAATFLHKLTVWGFVLFTATTLSIAFMETQIGSSDSVMSGREASVMNEEAAPAEPAEAMPAEGMDAQDGEAMDADSAASGEMDATDSGENDAAGDGDAAGMAPAPVEAADSGNPPGDG